VKLIAVVAPLSLLLLAADPPKQTAPTFLETLEVTISNVDVVVTDKHGKSISGLSAADFDVRENGEPQTITNFSAYATSSATKDLRRPEERRGTEEAVTVTAPPPRKFVFFIDDLSVQPQSRGKLTEDAHRFIESEMRPGDEAMIITPSSATKGELTFTADRAAIDKQIETLIDKAVLRTNTPQRAEQFFYETVVARASGEDYINKARIYATRVNRRVTTTLRALLGVVGSLTQTEGKKVLVIMSESLTAQPGREAFNLSQVMNANNEDISPDEFSGRNAFDTNTSSVYWYDARPMIRELGARATANGITIYSIQPDPGFAVGPTGLSAGSAPPRLTPLQIAKQQRLPPTAQIVSSADPAVNSFQREITEGTGTTLDSLAAATGGKFWRGMGDFDAAFRTMATDLDSYYSIGYRVSGSQNAIRHIDVAVKGRPDLVVRTRRDVMRYSPEREMDEIATAALLTTKDINELGITAEAAQPARTIDAYRVQVSVKIPLDKLTFIPQGDAYLAEFSVHYAAADGANYTTGEMRSQKLRVPASDIDVVRTHSYTYTSTLVVAPGTARISVGVFDKLSRLSGFQRLSVEAR